MAEAMNLMPNGYRIIRGRDIEPDLQYFAEMDEETTEWLKSLQYTWNLCKFLFKQIFNILN